MPWIQLAGESAVSSLGVLADSQAKLLWTCIGERELSTDPPGRTTYLKSLNLSSGELAASCASQRALAARAGEGGIEL